MNLLDLLHQVRGILMPRNGGTGNPSGWGTGVVQSSTNRSGATLAIGTVVEMYNRGCRAAQAKDQTNILGVVVGTYADGDGVTFSAIDCPSNRPAAVMTAGVCPVVIESDVTTNDFAFAAATDGQAYGNSTAGSGAFGQYVESGDQSVYAYARVRLFGGAALGAGGGATFGTPALVLGTTAAAGSTDEVIRRDSTIVAFDATVPTTLAPGDSAATGSAAKAARRDHAHAMAALKGCAVFVLPSPAGSQNLDAMMPYPGTFTRWTLLADASGSAVVDVWKKAYSSYPPTVSDAITGSGKPTISAATKGQGTSITATFSALDVVRINVDSSTGISRLTLVLEYTRTA